MAIRMSTALKNALLYNKPLITAMAHGVIHVYSGSQPSSANDSPSGTLLGSVTADGIDFTSGSTQGGLTLVAVPSLSYLVKPSAENWILTVSTSGLAGWWRFRSNNDASLNMDGSITPPYNELFIGKTWVNDGETRTIENFQIGFYW